MLKKILLLVLFLIVSITIVDRFLYYRSYNLILITIDTLRPDFLTCYNPNALPTPNIDQIAKRGTLFKNAYCLIPITLPSHSAIMTSHPPHKLNVFNNGEKFDAKVPTLAEILKQKKYATGAFVSLGVLKDDFGLNRGFSDYQNTDFKKRWYGTAQEVNGVFIPWLEKNSKRPFFAWVHYSDPHEPYILPDAPPDTEVFLNNASYAKFCLAKKEHNVLKFMAPVGSTEIKFQALKGEEDPHKRVLIDRISLKSANNVKLVLGEEWKGRIRPNKQSGMYFEDFASLQVVNSTDRPRAVRLLFDGKITQSIDVIRKNYAAEVQYLDRYVGELLKSISRLNISGKTIIALTADHGESLGEHKRIGHIYPLYTEITKVPLIIVYPGLGHEKKKNNRLVSHLDIMPTLLDLLHEKTNQQMEGQSLRRYVSWSPLDRMFSKPFTRQSSFTSTYAPQGRIDSFSVIHGDLKMIITGSENSDEKIEVYDLAHDPQELSNLASRSLPGATELRNSIHEYRMEAARSESKRSRPTLDEDDKEMLRDLGYIN